MQLPNEIIIPKVAEFLHEGHTVTLPLKGYSMRPYLEDGRDKALLTLPHEELKVGDVILAEIAPSRWALHRITRVNGKDIEMCGDGNITPEYITREDVIATAIGFYRKGSEQMTSINSMGYIIYWKTWIRLKPLRRYLLLLWRLKHNPKEIIKKIIKKILCK